MVAALAAAVAGCSGGSSEITESIREGNYFQKPIFSTPDWARARPTGSVSLGPIGPVAPGELVDAGGRCAPEAVAAMPQPEAAQAEASAAPAAPETPTPPAPPPGAAAYGSVAGDLASAPMPQGPPPKPMPARVKTASTAPDAGLGGLMPEGGASAPATLGGIALGMTECQAVRRGGQPSSVSISAGARGERKTVITYLSGPWPGIYAFDSGRLKEVDAAPVPEKPAKPTPKRKLKKKAKPAKTASGQGAYMQ